MTLNFHQKALLIGAVTVALCAGVFVWIVVLDKGTLAVTANPPYEISVEGNRLKVPETQTCTSDPCELRLPAGEFTLTVAKSGYFEETAVANIDRGETTTVEFSLTYVPIVGEVILMEGATPVAVPETLTSSPDFIFVDDLTYNKQRLDYVDPATQATTTWAYFDRPLVDPLVFPNADNTQALVVDQAKAMDQLYVVDGVVFSRASAGAIEDFSAAKWSPDGNVVFIEARSEAEGLLPVLFHLNLETLEITDWPLVSSLSKITLDEEGRWLFATSYDLSEANDNDPVTSLEIVQLVLDGIPAPKEQRVFSIGEYDPSTETYRSLYDVPASLELDYESIQMIYDETNGDLYFTDGTRFFEVIRG